MVNVTKKANQDIRDEMYISRVLQWEVAEAIGISEMTLVKWLRKEVSPEHREVIRAGIQKAKEIKYGKETDNGKEEKGI